MNRHFLIAGAAIAALSLAACGQKTTEGAATPAEQAATPSANPAATIPTPSNESVAMDFVPKAAATDMYELQAAKIAEKRSSNPAVKKFASAMEMDHTKSTDALKKALTDSGQNIMLPVSLPDDLQGKIDDLNKADAKDFDKTYADQMIDTHQDALNVLQRYAQDGDVPAIKTFAANTAPLVQQHLDMAKSLKDSLK